MNIAFDAKRAFTNGTGLGHYSRTLISSLAQYFPEHQYLLFTPKITNLFDVTGLNNVQVKQPKSFPSTLLRSAWRSSWVKSDLKKEGVNLYHGLSHEIPMGIEKTGIKTVVTIHDLIFERYPDQYKPVDVQIYRRKFKYACQNADRIIAISQQTRRDIMELYGTPEEKISICYQSCNEAFAHQVTEEEKERIRNVYNLPPRFFLYVGSIIERKNLLTICKALARIKQERIPLVVIGTGDYYMNRVKQYVRDNFLENLVIFLSDQPTTKNLPSFRNAADFPAIYQQALCMIYPSIYEGFGIPVLEALWSKLPVITSNLSCLPETGGDAALYVDPGSVDEMADAMLKIVRHQSVREEMINKGVLHAAHFTRRACAAKVMEVYQPLF